MAIINDEVQKIMKLIESSGYEVYLVGGFVRDSIIKKENKDYDLCTNMPFEKLKELISDMVIMRENNHRNTCVLRRNNMDIEISLFRGETLYDDLFSRDFTINSIAMNSEGKIIDLLDGSSDIDKKIIRLSDVSGNAFKIDPLRILRAIRFAGVLEFDIDENTLYHMNNNKNLLSTVAVERIYVEIYKILMCEKPGELILKYKDIFCEVIPELKSMIDFNQNNPYHVYDVFEHTMIVLDNTKNNPYLRFAALFHDTGKPKCYSVDEDGIGHFFGHAKESTDIFTSFANRLKIDKKSMVIIQKLIFFHDTKLGGKARSINKFLQLFGEENIELLFDLKLADILGQNPDKYSRLAEISKLREMYLDYLNSKPVLGIKDLVINGRTLQQMEFDGKIIGIILRDVLEMVTDEKLPNDREEIENYVTGKYR